MALKLSVFMLSAAIAGVGGALMTSQLGSANLDRYDIFLSLSLLVLTVVGGIGYVSGALFGGILFGVAFVALQNTFDKLGADFPDAEGFFEFLARFTTVLPALMGVSIGRDPTGAVEQIVVEFGALRRAKPVVVAGCARRGGGLPAGPQRQHQQLVVRRDRRRRDRRDAARGEAPGAAHGGGRPGRWAGWRPPGAGGRGAAVRGGRPRHARSRAGAPGGGPLTVVLLEARDVTVRFGGKAALSQTSIDVERGMITGLIGPNGAGKTTLFNVVCGLLTPQGGHVVLDGSDVTRAPPHRRARLGLARTFQRLELFTSLTVRDNIRVGGDIRNRWSRRRADSARGLRPNGSSSSPAWARLPTARCRRSRPAGLGWWSWRGRS